jgi:hypothetical protein
LLDLNNAGKQGQIEGYDLDDLSQRLADRASEWVPPLFPRGVIDRRRRELRLADISGKGPRGDGSCVIELKGDKAGCWFDFSTKGSGGPMSTLAQGTGLHGRDLFERAAEIVGVRKLQSNGVAYGSGNSHSSNGLSVGDRDGVAAASVNGHDTDEKPDKSARIRLILNDCVPATGTLAATYLGTHK